MLYNVCLSHGSTPCSFPPCSMFRGLDHDGQHQQAALVSVLVLYRCYNKLQQASWLETTQICYLTVPEVRSLKRGSLGWNQSVDMAAFLLGALEESVFVFSSFQRPSAFRGLWPLPASSKWATQHLHISLWLSSFTLSLIKTFMIALGQRYSPS